MNTKDLLKERIQKSIDQSFDQRLRDIPYFKFNVTEGQLKMLIVLIENIGQLTNTGLIELSDEEMIEAEGLYNAAVATLEEFLASAKNNYTDQTNLLRRTSSHGKD